MDALQHAHAIVKAYGRMVEFVNGVEDANTECFTGERRHIVSSGPMKAAKLGIGRQVPAHCSAPED